MTRKKATKNNRNSSNNRDALLLSEDDESDDNNDKGKENNENNNGKFFRFIFGDKKPERDKNTETATSSINNTETATTSVSTTQETPQHRKHRRRQDRPVVRIRKKMRVFRSRPDPVPGLSDYLFEGIDRSKWGRGRPFHRPPRPVAQPHAQPRLVTPILDPPAPPPAPAPAPVKTFDSDEGPLPPGRLMRYHPDDSRALQRNNSNTNAGPDPPPTITQLQGSLPTEQVM